MLKKKPRALPKKKKLRAKRETRTKKSTTESRENRRKTLRNEYSSTNILDQKVMHEVNLSDSEIRKLKILSLRMLVTVKQDNKKTRDSSCCVFLNFFSPLLFFFKNSNTQVSLFLSALRCKKTLSFCVYRSSTRAHKYR